jgi:hypothetical protein
MCSIRLIAEYSRMKVPSLSSGCEIAQFYTLFNTAGLHALQHGWRARSLTRLVCTLFDMAGMHALRHGWHARSLTRLVCTLFDMAGVHAL